MSEPKRRLPLITNKPPGGGASAGDLEEERPPHQWVAFGVVLLFAAWVPLSAGAEALKDRLVRQTLGEITDEEQARQAVAVLSAGERTRLVVATAIAHGLPLVLAAMCAGYVVARWGGQAVAPAGPREAALAGLAAALLAAILVWVQGWGTGGLTWTPLLPVLLAVPSGWVGGKLGQARRARRDGRPRA